MDKLRRVYYNLHLQCYSVQAKIEGRWKVIGHTDDICLKNVNFKVYERARQRVIETKTKNVHSFILGDLTERKNDIDLIRVRYNPYINGYFFLEDNSPIYEAKYIEFTTLGVFVSGV